MDSFYDIFKIYLPEEKIDFKTINKIYYKFNSLMNSDPNLNDSKFFNKIVVYLIEIFIKAKNIKFNFKELLDNIDKNNNLKKEKINKLYDYLFLTYSNDNKNVSKYVFEKLIKYCEIIQGCRDSI